MNAANECRVHVAIVLHDRAICPLRQFVIAHQEMNSLWKLTFQRAKQIEQLMRFIATQRIIKFPVDDFLQDQMPTRKVCEISRFVNCLKIPNVPVQITSNKNFVALLQRN